MGRYHKGFLKPQWRSRLTAAAVMLAVAFIIYTLRQLFRGSWQVDPVLLRIGPLTIRWYGVMIALGVLAGYSLADRIAPWRRISTEQVFTLLVLTVPAGLIGARLAFVIQNLPYFAGHPGEILRTWQGGLSMHGAVAAALLIFAAYQRATGLSLLRVTDIAAPAALIGQAIGRWGNFFNQEVIGYPTNVPWKMYVRPENRPLDLAEYAYYHPAFLYESLWNAAAALFLLRLLHRPGARDGDGLWLYLILYSLGRFFVEFFRIGTPYWAGLTLAQLVSLLLILVGTAGFLVPRLFHGVKNAGKSG